jgi:Fic family protein
MENMPANDIDKLKAILAQAKLTKSQIARLLETTYRNVHRWLEEGIEPQPIWSKRIDELFKDTVDVIPFIDKAVKGISDPSALLRANDKLRDKFFLETTYNSNAIEGSRMTLKETEQALEGKNVRGKEQFEIFEAVNHRNALKFMLDEVKHGFKISEAYILNLHSIVMYNFHNKLPGKYRTGYVNLTNTEIKLPAAQLVPGRMEKLIADMHKKPEHSMIKNAAICHYEFERIHPFFDGNGRVGRLLLNTHLLSHGYPPALIRIDDQAQYYLGLGRADMGENNNLIQMIGESVVRGYQLLQLAMVVEPVETTK